MKFTAIEAETNALIPEWDLEVSLGAYFGPAQRGFRVPMTILALWMNGQWRTAMVQPDEPGAFNHVPDRYSFAFSMDDKRLAAELLPIVTIKAHGALPPIFKLEQNDAAADMAHEVCLAVYREASIKGRDG